MDDFKTKFDEAASRIYNYTFLDNRLPREYAQDITLMPREMHILEAINHHPGVNATDLSTITGVPKGTVSKMIAHLEEKEFIVTYHMEGDQRKMYYTTTPKGTEAFEAHLRFHKTHEQDFYDMLENLGEEQQEMLLFVLTKYGDMMKTFFEKRSYKD